MRRVGSLVFPGFELLDLFEPLEMFGLLKDDFDLQLVAETTEPVSSDQQVRANQDVTFKDTDLRCLVRSRRHGSAPRGEQHGSLGLD